MRKIILLFSIVFLYDASGTAQKTISKIEFDHLVDYANCKYVMAFIEKHDKRTEYYPFYQKNLKEKLESASLEDLDRVLDYSELYHYLGRNKLARRLAEIVDKKKAGYKNYHEDSTLINSLKVRIWDKIDLRDVAQDVQTSLLAKYLAKKKGGGLKQTTSESNFSMKEIQTRTKVSELESKLNRLQHDYESLKNQNKKSDYQKSSKGYGFKIIFNLGIVLMIILLINFFILKRYLREYLKKSLGNSSNKTKEKFNTGDNKLSENDIKTIAYRVMPYIRNEPETTPQPKVNISETNIEPETKLQPKVNISEKNIEPAKSSPKYLKGKSGKKFNRVENTPENSFFKLFNISNNVADFEFCGDEAEAIAKRIFSDDICKVISGSYLDAHHVIKVQPGRVRYIDDEWLVIEPVEIRFV